MSSKLPPVLPDAVVELFDSMALVAAPYRGLPELILEQPGGNGPESTLICNAFYLTLRLASSVTIRGGSFVPNVAGTAEDTLAMWNVAADRCSSPIVRARLHHLLFDASHGRPHEHARAAAAAYIEIASLPLPSGEDHMGVRLNYFSAAEWGHELARRMGDRALVAEAEIAVVHLITESLASGRKEPGVVVPLLERLVDYGPTHPELRELLESAHVVYTGDRWQLPRIIQLQRRLLRNDPVKEIELRRAEVEVLLAHAKESKGIARQSHYETAARRAAELGLKDLREQAIRELQAIAPEDLGLVPIVREIQVSTEDLMSRMERIAASSTIAELLSRLVGGLPPSGDADENRRTIEAELSGQDFLSASAATKFLGEGSLPSYEPNSEEAEFRAAMAMRESELMMIFALPIVEGLTRALAQLAHSVDQLSMALVAPPDVSQASANSIARSIDAFGAGRYEEAACLAVIRVETQVRVLCAKRGKLLFEIEQGRRRGQFPALGSMLSELEQEVDYSWWRFLDTFLVGQAGVNYRNRLFHGYLDEVDGRHAVLSILCALYLARDPGAVLRPAPNRNVLE